MNKIKANSGLVLQHELGAPFKIIKKKNLLLQTFTVASLHK